MPNPDSPFTENQLQMLRALVNEEKSKVSRDLESNGSRYADEYKGLLHRTINDLATISSILPLIAARDDQRARTATVSLTPHEMDVAMYGVLQFVNTGTDSEHAETYLGIPIHAATAIAQRVEKKLGDAKVAAGW